MRVDHAARVRDIPVAKTLDFSNLHRRSRISTIGRCTELHTRGADCPRHSFLGFLAMFDLSMARSVCVLGAGAIFLVGCAEEKACTGIIAPTRALSAAPASLELDVGGSASVGATFSSSCSDDNPAVQFTSSDTSIVRVVANAAGGAVVTALRPGPAFISLSAIGPSTTSVPVTVRAPVVQSIALSNAAVRVRERQTATLTATVASTGLLTRRVIFTSLTPEIATVTAIDSVSATITGVSTGATTISVLSVADSTKTATATITVDAALVATVTLGGVTTPDSLLLTGTRQLTATSRDPGGVELTGRTVTWTSSAPTVITVSATGALRALTTGSAQISATVPIGDSSGTRAATATIAVFGTLQVAVTPRTATVQVGQTVALSATVTGTAGIPRAVQWESSAPAQATVSSTGVVTAVASNAAPVVIRARSTAIATALDSSIVTVSSSSVPTTLMVSPRLDTLSPLGARTLSATVRDQRGVVLPATISWRALNPTLATVNNSGVVTAVANGTARIVASSLIAGTDSLRDTATFQIVAPCSRIRVVTLGTTVAGSFDASSCRNFLGFTGALDQYSLANATQAYYTVTLTPTFRGSLVPLNIGSGFYGLPTSDTTVAGMVVTKPGAYGFMVNSNVTAPATYTVSTTLNPDARQNCFTTDATRGVSFQTALVPTCRQRDIRILPQLSVLGRIIVTARAQSFPARIDLVDFNTGATLATSTAGVSGGTATINYIGSSSRFVLVRVIGGASVNDTVAIVIDDQ